MTIPTSFEQVTHNSPDGAQVGQGTGEKIAFFGSTPVAQQASSSQAAVTGTVGAALGTTGTADTTTTYGFTTTTQADAITTRVNQCVVDSLASTILVTQLRAELVTLGLIPGA